MRESEVEQYLKHRVREAGGRAFKWTSPGRAGVPDQIVLWPGGAVSFVEVKRPAGIVSKIQKLTIEEMLVLGHDVSLCWSTEQVDEFIAERVHLWAKARQ